MPGLLTFGAVFILLIVGAGGSAWWRAGRSRAGGTRQPRTRVEARRVQARFDADEDFARNFHRPTQNEVLETLQMLDHLTPSWDHGDDALIARRLKNELAESFPTLRKHGCGYPQTRAEAVALRAGAAGSPGALPAQFQTQAAALARRRAEFQRTRACANALHQLTVQEVAPVVVEPDPIPSHVSEGPVPRRPAVVAKRLGALAMMAGLTLVGWYLALAGWTRSEHQTPSPSLAVAGPGIHPPASPNEFTVAASPALNPVERPTARGEAVAGAPAPLAPPTRSSEHAAVMDDVVPATAASETATVSARVSPPPSKTLAANVLVPAAPAPLSPEMLLAPRVAESKLRAVGKHPDLLVPNSEINLRFVFRYKTLLTEHSPRLQDPQWPEKLADECAAAGESDPKRGRITRLTARPQ